MVIGALGEPSAISGSETGFATRVPTELWAEARPGRAESTGRASANGVSAESAAARARRAMVLNDLAPSSGSAGNIEREIPSLSRTLHNFRNLGVRHVDQKKRNRSRGDVRTGLQ